MTTLDSTIFNRTTRLVGPEVMNHLHQVRVLIVGVGGVGSWCAEGLVRSGVMYLTIVDSDRVSVTNINRQLMATTRTVGRVKVDVLRERLLEINPEAEVVALQKIYTDEVHESFELGSYDYIIDAVDSLKDKISLILRSCETDAVLFSSMGAALKIDPTQVRVSEFWKVQGCPLGALVRRRMKRMGVAPAKKFLCVYDPEVCENRGPVDVCPNEFGNDSVEGDEALADHDWAESKAQVNGTTAPVTAIFGMTLAGLVVQHVNNQIMIK